MSAPDRQGNCALWAALDSHQDDIASILVRHGADTDCWGAGPDGCQQTLLHRFVTCQYISLINIRVGDL